MKIRTAIMILSSTLFGYLCLVLFRFYFHVDYPGAQSLKNSSILQIMELNLSYHWLNLLVFATSGGVTGLLKRSYLHFFTAAMLLLVLREWMMASDSEAAFRVHAWTAGALGEGFAVLANLTLIGLLVFGFRFYERRKTTEQ